LTIIRQLADSRVLKSYSTQRIAKDGTVQVWITSTALVNEDGRKYAIATTERAEGIETDSVMETRNDRQG
jgi:two-component system CheB/CheR fusion protein